MTRIKIRAAMILSLFVAPAYAQNVDLCAQWGAVRGTPQYLNCQMQMFQMQQGQVMQQRAAAQQLFHEGLRNMACGFGGGCR